MKENYTAEEKRIRREKNREHAQKSRMKKRLLIDTLEMKIEELQNENNKLREIIKEHTSEKSEARSILKNIEEETEKDMLCASDTLFDKYSNHYLQI